VFVSATHVTEFNRYAIILKYFDELWTERLTLGHRKTFQNRFGLRSTHEFNSRHNKLVGPGIAEDSAIGKLVNPIVPWPGGSLSSPTYDDFCDTEPWTLASARSMLPTLDTQHQQRTSGESRVPGARSWEQQSETDPMIVGISDDNRISEKPGSGWMPPNVPRCLQATPITWSQFLDVRHDALVGTLNPHDIEVYAAIPYLEV